MGHPALRKINVSQNQRQRTGVSVLFGATPVRGGVGGQQVPHRAFRPIRNDKVFLVRANAFSWSVI
jgi:hypothetical protein